MCLDIKTGKLIWYYQLTHHDIWDYDMPTAPILADITVNGRPIKAVVQLTKQAFAFVFDLGRAVNDMKNTIEVGPRKVAVARTAEPAGNPPARRVR